MRVDFLHDRETGLPHVESHGVATWEAVDVLTNCDFVYNGRKGTRIAVGQTRHGRYLRVIYRTDERDNSRLVITAYDLPPKAKAAFRRRRRK